MELLRGHGPFEGRIVDDYIGVRAGSQYSLLGVHPEDSGGILGRNLDEAFVVCQILEKACKAFIEAEFLGGAKSINRVEAFLMHQVYLRKYSALKDENPRDR